MAEKKYYWLKFQHDFFSSKRIKKLRSLAGGDTFTIIYLKMQLLSIENDGMLEYTGIEPTFAEEIALDIDEKPENVGVTINYLLSCGLMEIIDEHHMVLPYAVNNIGSETATAERMRRSRALKESAKVNEKITEERNNVTQMLQSCYTNVPNCYTEKEIEKEIEIEINKRVINNSSSDEVRPSEEDQSVLKLVRKWNELESLGINKVIRIDSHSKRYASAKARINQYGFDKCVEAIENIRNSDFLQGRNQKNWVITFDWFVLPNNFPKILEGNYANKELKQETPKKIKWD